MLDGEVRHADSAGLRLGKLNHSCIRGQPVSNVIPTARRCELTLPGVDDGDAVINHDIPIGVGARGIEGEVVVTSLEYNRPVDQVQLRKRLAKQGRSPSDLQEWEIMTYVEIVQPELLQTPVQRRLNVLRAVLAIGWSIRGPNHGWKCPSPTCSIASMSAHAVSLAV